MLIEPAIYLNALLRDFQIAGGRVVIREFNSPEEVWDTSVDPAVTERILRENAALFGSMRGGRKPSR